MIILAWTWTIQHVSIVYPRPLSLSLVVLLSSFFSPQHIFPFFLGLPLKLGHKNTSLSDIPYLSCVHAVSCAAPMILLMFNSILFWVYL